MLTAHRTERDALLAEVKAGGFDDVLLLAFADFLGESGAGDRDAATAEFIRAACDLRPGGRRLGPAMAPPAYLWLKNNWARLVPAAVALNLGPPAAEPGHPPFAHRRGRTIVAYWWLRPPPTGGWPVPPLQRTYSVRLRFLRGFLESATLYPRAVHALAPALRADQPLAVLSGGGPS